MTKRLHGIGLTAGILAWLLPGCVFGAQATSQIESPKIIALLPGGFKGWACIDFGVGGALPLPREGDSLIFRFHQGEALRTSDKPSEFPRFYEARYEINGERRPLPRDVYCQREVRLSDSKNPVQRYCAFYGTEDDADAAAEPPGFESSPQERRGVSEEERQALVALYKATDGEHWNHRVGWLGARGTECKWHGVSCWSELGGPMAVTGLALYQNNLVGTIPPALGQLSHLKDLEIFGNHLSGMLSPKLIQRWLTGALEVSAEAPLLTDVTMIEFESDPPTLCGGHRITLGSDGRAKLFTTRCRDATPDDQTTFCEVKVGRVLPGPFSSLGWLLEKNGFYGLRTNYERNATDRRFERTRVIKHGNRFEVGNYADAGPFELWVIQTAIQGVGSSVGWEKSTAQPECPKWNEPATSQHE